MDAASGLVSAEKQRMDFMKLLITQMQNQNPFEPMDNNEMAAQLAQFSQLELSEKMNNNIATMNSTMEKMNLSFQGAMLVAELDYAKSLLNKEVSFYSDYYEQMMSGQVEEINIVNGSPSLGVGVTVTHPNSTQEEVVVPVRLNEIEGIKS